MNNKQTMTNCNPGRTMRGMVVCIRVPRSLSCRRKMGHDEGRIDEVKRSEVEQVKRRRARKRKRERVEGKVSRDKNSLCKHARLPRCTLCARRLCYVSFPYAFCSLSRVCLVVLVHPTTSIIPTSNTYWNGGCLP